MTPPYVAQLRVYEPLGAFPAEERQRWEAYLRAGQAPGRIDGPVVERTAGLGATVRRVPRLPRDGECVEHAYVAYVEGVPLVCPWRTTVRCWQAATALSMLLPDRVAGAMLPAEEVATAATSYAQWSTEHPELRNHIRTSRWTVPARWYLLFDQEERRLRLGDGRAEPGTRGGVEAAERSLVYVTGMSAARRRAARGLAMVRRAMDHGPVVAGIEDVARWLEEFHPRAVVELDYAGLVHLLADEELRSDNSAADVAEAMAALGRGDIEDARTAYDRVIARWRTAQLVETAN